MRVRECESARVRECESERVQERKKERKIGGGKSVFLGNIRLTLNLLNSFY